jgi:uncharacterized membrane protein
MRQPVSKFRYILLQLRSKLWLKPALTGFGAVAWIEIALMSSDYTDLEPPFGIEREILLSLLQILASTMLTVAIFAVTAMVAAFSSVSTTASPRATRIVMQDRSTQNALAAFLSAFIYAIVALVALSAIPYGAFGRFTLFGGYVFIVGWVLFSFVRWVDQISKLGRMQDTIQRVEESCQDAFSDPMIAGTLGAKPLGNDTPEGIVLHLGKVGYIQHIDIAEIQEVAKELGTTIHIFVRPGSFIDRNRPLGVLANQKDLEKHHREKLVAAFTIGDERHVEADPHCGLLMLAEIADRALSPAVNDPGTAISVIGTQLRLLTNWVDATREETKCLYPDVEVPPLAAGDLLDDGLTPIARDGAAMFEVGARLQKALGALHRLDHPGLSAAAELHSELALEQAMEKLPTGYHRERMREIAENVVPS